MLRKPAAPWPVSRRLAAVGEVAAMAASARRLLRAVRAERLSQLTPITASEPLHRPRFDVPVLLVHGYLGTPACWTHVVPQLHGAGFVNVFSLGYNALASTIPVLAADVVGAAEAARGQARADGVHLVGHSLGGLVIRYAVQQLGLSSTARSVVTIATPHQGSPFASVAPGVVGAQMRPGSSLLHHLPPLSSTPQVSWLVVDSAQDIVVSKPRPRVDGGARYRVVNARGHQAILRSDELVETLVGHLVEVEQARAGTVVDAA
ncbi:MAG: alpha/beta fold hydrolase [Dermatophilaceae bacterium]